HALADDRRLSDDDAGTVVDEKTRADLRSRVDIDTGCRMRKLCDDAGEEGNTQEIEFVSQAMVSDCPNARIADPYLFDALGRGVALVGSQNIVFEQRTHLRQTCGKLACHLDRLPRSIATALVRLPGRKLQFQAHLLGQRSQRRV